MGTKTFKPNDKVYYRNHDGSEDHGFVTSINDMFVFVCFDGTGRGVACRPEDIHHSEDKESDEP